MTNHDEKHQETENDFLWKPFTYFKNDGDVDFVFMLVHGASFSSAMFQPNFKRFTDTLKEIDQEWFWETEYNYQVEFIDWKKYIFPYQSALLRRLNPIGSIDEEEFLVNYANEIDNFDPNEIDKNSFVEKKIDAELKENIDSEDKEVSKKKSDSTPDKKLNKEDYNLNKSISRVLHWLNLDVEIKNDLTSLIEDKTPVNTSNLEYNDIPKNVKEFEKLLSKLGIRGYLCNTILDILYFFSPRYGGYIVSKVTKMLNEKISQLRSSSCGKYKNSKFVLIGHSLGSIILYELLSGHTVRYTSFETVDLSDETFFPNINLPPIAECIPPSFDHAVDYVFFIGSPLGAYLSFRNEKSLCGGQPFRKTVNKNAKFYNIFHRYDPITTRLEPIMYNKKKSLPPPVMIKSYNTNVLISKSLDFVRSAQLKNAAQFLLNKLFNYGEKCPTAKFNMLLTSLQHQRRYSLPSLNSPFERYGNLNFSFETTKYEILLTNSDQEEVNDQTPINSHNPSVNHKDIKIDRKFFDFDQKNKHCWTFRQLYINITRKLRRYLASYAEELIRNFKKNYENKKDVGYKSIYEAVLKKPSSSNSNNINETVKNFRKIYYGLIDTEIAQFLSSLTDQNLNLVFEYDLLMSKKEWLEQGFMRDMDMTKNLCKKEILERLSGDDTDLEEEDGRELPSRIDFCSRGKLHQVLFAPIGFIQSHLQYWSCQDTIFFIMKQITQTSPKINLTSKNEIDQKTNKLKKKIKEILQKIIV